MTDDEIRREITALREDVAVLRSQMRLIGYVATATWGTVSILIIGLVAMHL